ncbi:MAG TPA: ABC transporter ATP-binding protein [Candidatus Babeliaceae bacterium]|nr:ABC transporter ATP-binding protein [Candidatus Babeliaceae bacterium]
MLSVTNVTKRFGDKQALKGVSLTIDRGEIVSLLGANGAGKTTLSSIIAALRPVTSGEIAFEGASIYDDIIWYRQRIGYCSQKATLNAALTLEENLIHDGRYFGLELNFINDRIAELSHSLELAPYLKEYPHVLSGGYQQRFSIARALMHNPALVILDEPTVALDPHIRRKLWDIIIDLKKGGTAILLTTHYLEEAEVLSDKVCVLDQGLVRLIDTPENLMASFQKSNLEEVFLHLLQESQGEG